MAGLQGEVKQGRAGCTETGLVREMQVGYTVEED